MPLLPKKIAVAEPVKTGSKHAFVKVCKFSGSNAKYKQGESKPCQNKNPMIGQEETLKKYFMREYGHIEGNPIVFSKHGKPNYNSTEKYCEKTVQQQCSSRVNVKELVSSALAAEAAQKNESLGYSVRKNQK